MDASQDEPAPRTRPPAAGPAAAAPGPATALSPATDAQGLPGAVGRQAPRDSADAGWRALRWAVDTLAAAFESGPRSAVVDDGPPPYGADAGEDGDAYRAWLHDIEIALGSPAGNATAAPVLTLVVALGDATDTGLRRCVASLRAQSHRAWELYLCDDGTGDAEMRAYLESVASEDRVTVVRAETSGQPGPTDRGVAAAMGAALHGARGELVALLGHDGQLTPDALATVARRAVEEPAADVIYSDEDELDTDGRPARPRFKPDWSPNLLMATPYLGRLTFVRRRLLDDIGGITDDPGVDREYDLMLRATARARSVVHIPRVLYRSPARGTSGDEAPHGALAGGETAGDRCRRALRRAVIDRHLDARVEDGLLPGTFRLRRRPRGMPSISIIVPFRDEGPLLRSCVDSLRHEDAPAEIEIVLVDNGSVAPETQAVAQALCRRPRVRLLEHPGPFNWSKINNAAAATCRSDLLLFLNNDVEAAAGDWITGLVEEAQRPEVGAVGCRLLYPDGALQHAGVVLGMHVLAGHVMCGLPGERPGYLGWAKTLRDTSAVSAACMMCRRGVFAEMGGFGDEYAVAFNDVDFCLRLRAAGYEVVCTPFTELVHHESRTRGTAGYYHDYQAFLRAWTSVITRGDPFYNVNLSRLDLRCRLRPLDEDERWQKTLSRLTSSSGE